MQRVRIRKNIDVDALPWPAPVITRDVLERVTVLQFTYASIVVTYNAAWIGETNLLDTYTQAVVDRP